MEEGEGLWPQPRGQLPSPLTSACAMATFAHAPLQGRETLQAPLLAEGQPLAPALEMISSSRDGRITFRVRPTEAQQRPVTLRVQGHIPATCAPPPTPAPGVLRGTLAPVLRQGDGTAHHPRADIWQPREAWHRNRVISKHQLSLPGVTVRSGPQLPPTEVPVTPQPLGFWLLLFLPPWGPP